MQATNDGWHDGSVDSGPTRSFERLLRKLLMHVRMPAVVLVETLATDVRKLGLPFYATGECVWGVAALLLHCTCAMPHALALRGSLLGTQPHVCHTTLTNSLSLDSHAILAVPWLRQPAEDHYGVLAQYYSLPWLSYRNAVWHGLMADVPGFRRSQIFPPDEERHPTPLGHRYIADMTIHLLQTAFLDGLLTPLGALEPRLMQVCVVLRGKR